MFKVSLPTPAKNSAKLVRNVSLYSSLMLFLVFINYKYNPLGAYPADVNDTDQILITLKTMKILSLFMIFLESIEALFRLGDKSSHKILWRFAKTSSLVCIATVVLLIATLKNSIYLNTCALLTCSNIEHFKIALDSLLSILPLVGFMAVNLMFMYKLDVADKAYKTARNYFFIVNMPGVISLVLVQCLVYMLLNEGNYISIAIFNSGAIASLIFMSLCLSLYAETIERNDIEVNSEGKVQGS